MVDRTEFPRWLVGGGAALALVGTFMPWLSSGTVPRSSYELFELVERLGFSHDGVVGWALRLWPLAPLLLVLAAVAQGAPHADRRVRLARLVLALLSIVYVGGTAAAVWLAPEGGLFRLRFGIWVTLIGAATMLVGLSLALGRPVSRPGSEPSAAS